jgi:hypothetical protein
LVNEWQLGCGTARDVAIGKLRCGAELLRFARDEDVGDAVHPGIT